MIGDFISAALGSHGEFGPLLGIPADIKEGRRYVSWLQLREKKRRENRVWAVIKRQRDKFRAAAAIFVRVRAETSRSASGNPAKRYMRIHRGVITAGSDDRHAE